MTGSLGRAVTCLKTSFTHLGFNLCQSLLTLIWWHDLRFIALCLASSPYSCEKARARIEAQQMTCAVVGQPEFGKTLEKQLLLLADLSSRLFLLEGLNLAGGAAPGAYHQALASTWLLLGTRLGRLRLLFAFFGLWICMSFLFFFNHVCSLI